MNGLIDEKPAEHERNREACRRQEQAVPWYREDRVEQLRVATQHYFDHYMQDEAAGPEWACCGEEQHAAAVAVKDALAALESNGVKIVKSTKAPAEA